MSLDLSIRTPSLHVGALRVFRASEVIVRIRHSLFLVSSWVLGDRFEFEYRLDHPYHVTLDCVFHLTSLSYFLLRAFVFLSWLDTSFHFAITYLMLRDMFFDHDHLVFALYTYHGLSTSSFVWSWIRFLTRCSYFYYGKVKNTFLHSHFFRDIRLDHLTIFFSYGARVEGWFKDMWL